MKVYYLNMCSQVYIVNGSLKKVVIYLINGGRQLKGIDLSVMVTVLYHVRHNYNAHVIATQKPNAFIGYMFFCSIFLQRRVLSSSKKVIAYIPIDFYHSLYRHIIRY